MKRYLLNVLIAIDQLVNALIGGYPDETLSASAYIGEQEGRLLPRFFRPVIDGLFRILGETDHCRNAANAERRGVQLPESLR